MEKLNINKLIANDIVNYGMDKTTNFNYIVSLNDFLDDYDDESRSYIKSHISDIINAVHQNENVADLHYDESRQEFDMVFYFDNLITPLERTIYNNSEKLGYSFEIDELREISYKIENSDDYKKLIDDTILNNTMNMGREI